MTGGLLGALGTLARMKLEVSDWTEPISLKAVTMNRNSRPFEAGGKEVIRRLKRLGWFLTLVSMAALTSVQVVPPAPSLMKTAYPVMGQPPTLRGAVQARVSEVAVEATL